jgi:hypothetical protein
MTSKTMGHCQPGYFLDQNMLSRTSPLFLPDFVARWRRRAKRKLPQGARRESAAGVLDSTSRRPPAPNAVDMPGSAAAAEGW